MKFKSTILLTNLLLRFLPSTFAADCDASGLVTCTIKDEREEFKNFLGRPCEEFEKQMKIVRGKKYSGVNKNGYPQIKVEYLYKVCNNNDEQRKRIKIDLSQTKTKVGKETVKGIKGGNISGGKCRKSAVTATLNSKQRYHNASLQLSGFLFKGGKLFNGEKESLVQCLASSNYQSRLQYDDDCGVKVKAKCTIKDTGESCEGRILRTSDTDCRSIDVQYRFKICNNENQAVKLNKSTSNIKIGGKIYKKITPILPAKKCYTVKSDDVIKTCKPELTETAISVSARGRGKFKECRGYSFQRIEVGDAYPSASPSSAPSVSSMPSGSPSISHQPSLSAKPSALPSSSPSSRPTKKPSSSPSESPTKSVSPSFSPTPVPTTSPSAIPSASPSTSPTISSAPSQKPSASPTISAMPSCVPSASPTESAAPSKQPTRSPTTSPSDSPTTSPSKSQVPTVPLPPGGQRKNRRTTRTLKSSKKGKSSYKAESKSSKAKSPKYTSRNICQD